MSGGEDDLTEGDLVGLDPTPIVPEHVLEAIRTLIRWAGDDPDREGLLDTPRRVAKAWREYCSGYGDEPAKHLSRVFEEVGGYDEIVLLRDIPFQSLCMHHLLPFIGHAHVAYLPGERIVGLSKLARVVDTFARDLQLQERMTVQIADWLDRELQPRGVGVVLSAEHTSRHESVIRQRLREARFPEVKTLDTFDFGAAEGLSAPQIHTLARGEWVTQPENLILAGPIGTGKTHLAIALGVEATKQKRRVLFTRAADLVRQLLEARDARSRAQLPVRR